MQSDPKKLDLKALKEQRNLMRGINLRQNAGQLPLHSFISRKNTLVADYKRGAYLKDPDSVGKPAGNPMSDPAGMDQMMNMLKGNMAMIVPQTLIMGWINAFFSGFVISEYPQIRDRDGKIGKRAERVVKRRRLDWIKWGVSKISRSGVLGIFF
jgi:hypothetical protein